MPGPRLTYVGHSYHRRTGSTLFLQDLLATSFEVTTLWDESWQPGAAPLNADAINRSRPDCIVLFQQLPSRAEFARLQCRNVIWVPMHDSITHGWQWEVWQPSHVKVLCFSTADERYFSSLGYDTLHAQYCPRPRAQSAEAGTVPLSVFFWMRRNEVTWETLKRLLGSVRPERIVLRAAADPGHAPAMPSEEDRREYSIEIHEGWMDASRYYDLLRGCSVFMVPRPREGIGQALLEARAEGLVAIAPDAPTMNEYLRHGVNGLLYDLAAPKPLELSNLARIRAQSLADLETGHRAWQASAPAVLDFVRKPAKRAAWWWRLRSAVSRRR